MGCVNKSVEIGFSPIEGKNWLITPFSPLPGEKSPRGFYLPTLLAPPLTLYWWVGENRFLFLTFYSSSFGDITLAFFDKFLVFVLFLSLSIWGLTLAGFEQYYRNTDT